MKEYFSYVNNLILIRRFTTSQLSRNSKNNFTSFTFMISSHIVKTIKVKYNEKEKFKI